MSWNLHDEEELRVLEQRLLEGMPPVASTAIALIAALREARAALAETRRDLHEARTDVRDLLKLRETNERLTRERDEARQNFLACAQAIGIVYQADGHNDHPGPVGEVVKYINEAREALDGQVDIELLVEELDAARAQLAKVTEERDRLRALLVRVEKYCREDEARTPGVTRLDRCLNEVRAALSQSTGPAPAESRPDERCKRCGHPGSDHPYRHPFQPWVPAGRAPADTKTEGER